MIKIDWHQDYQGEFICPNCKTRGMTVRAVQQASNKRLFYCSICRERCQESCHVGIQAIADPTNFGVIWYTDHKIKGFVCPNCQSEDMYFKSLSRIRKDELGTRKKEFLCKSCNKRLTESIDLTRRNISFRSGITPPVKTFNFDEDQWDLRAINPNFDLHDLSISTMNFADIHPDWFKVAVKDYVQHLCKTSSAFGTISIHLVALRSFSCYLNQSKVFDFCQINRSLILDYLAYQQKGKESKVAALRSFFATGTARGWFNIDQNVIRDEDYPKRHRGNPDPISDIVRGQIEQNLHKLPDPIARMWIICFFAAMRPSELALLKQNCLIQEGEHWKLVWQRKKGNDYHEVPISRTIAKVVQEQQEYIQNLWGDEWEYLFCHYHGLPGPNVEADPLLPKLEPVKKVIPSNTDGHSLVVGIRCLIQNLDIRDENGQLTKFTTKLLRTTRLTQLFEQGHDLAVVSAWAGHKKLGTTSLYYTKVSCELMEREAGHIQQALVNRDGHPLRYESFPKSFWKTPQAHKLELFGTHINTPIYGFCGLPLDQDCHKFRACYTCGSFVAVPEKLSQYILTRDELRAKESLAKANGQDVLVEQFGRQADQLDKIITGLHGAA